MHWRFRIGIVIIWAQMLYIFVTMAKPLNGKDSAILKPEENLERAKQVRVGRATEWNKGLEKGAVCQHDGERCSVGLVCERNNTVAETKVCKKTKMAKSNLMMGGMPIQEAVVNKIKEVAGHVLGKEGEVCNPKMLKLCGAGLVCTPVVASGMKVCVKSKLPATVRYYRFSRSGYQRSSSSHRSSSYSSGTSSPSYRSSSYSRGTYGHSYRSSYGYSRYRSAYSRSGYSSSRSGYSRYGYASYRSRYSRSSRSLRNAEEEIAQKASVPPDEYLTRSKEVFQEHFSCWRKKKSSEHRERCYGGRCSGSRVCVDGHCVNKTDENQDSEAKKQERLEVEHNEATKGTKVGDKCESVGSPCSPKLVCRADKNEHKYCV